MNLPIVQISLELQELEAATASISRTTAIPRSYEHAAEEAPSQMTHEPILQTGHDQFPIRAVSAQPLPQFAKVTGDRTDEMDRPRFR